METGRRGGRSPPGAPVGPSGELWSLSQGVGATGRSPGDLPPSSSSRALLSLLCFMSIRRSKELELGDSRNDLGDRQLLEQVGRCGRGGGEAGFRPGHSRRSWQVVLTDQRRSGVSI